MVIDDLAACALQSTVVGTTATADYAVPLHRLATTAAKVGFPCIAVQAIDRGFPWVAPLTKNSSLFHTLPDIAPFWPRERFCDEHETRYGWRRVHVYMMRMWLTVLQSGYDLFSVDADWMFIRNPVARLRAAHELRPSFADPRNLSDPYRFVRTAVGTEPADFVALVHDGMTRRQINIGLVYVRAGDRTIALARTLLNRSYAAQDQPLVNEELNWGHVNVSCCISEVRWASPGYKQPLNKGCKGIQDYLVRSRETHLIKRQQTREHQAARVCTNASDTPPALGPPKTSPQRWTANWNARAYNERRGTTQLGRCSRIDNMCSGCQATSA
jgi:hypothetical protein